MSKSIFADRPDKHDLETGTAFSPKFDKDGLLPAIATDAKTGDVLMLAYMNEQALSLSIETGVAHYWSRSRNKLWKKGESSGNTQTINRTAHRLRSGRHLDEGGAKRPRCRLPCRL